MLWSKLAETGLFSDFQPEIFKSFKKNLKIVYLKISIPSTILWYFVFDGLLL